MAELTILFDTECLLSIVTNPAALNPVHIRFPVRMGGCLIRLQDAEPLGVAGTALRFVQVNVGIMAERDHSWALFTQVEIPVFR